VTARGQRRAGGGPGVPARFQGPEVGGSGQARAPGYWPIVLGVFTLSGATLKMIRPSGPTGLG
jgi:hypothetical protein